jgi:hypothetical protein
MKTSAQHIPSAADMERIADEQSDATARALVRLLLRIARARLLVMAPADVVRHVADLRRGNAVIAFHVNAGLVQVKFNPPMEGVGSWFN